LAKAFGLQFLQSSLPNSRNLSKTSTPQVTMRQRITLLHQPEDAVDPASIEVTKDSFKVAGIKAAREDRITLGIDELPEEIHIVLKQSHELHIRHVNRIFYESIPPFLARLSPGLHVFYSPQRKSNNAYVPLSSCYL
jgi:hypothetical protein